MPGMACMEATWIKYEKKNSMFIKYDILLLLLIFSQGPLPSIPLLCKLFMENKTIVRYHHTEWSILCRGKIEIVKEKNRIEQELRRIIESIRNNKICGGKQHLRQQQQRQ